jgi:hypothetical protein
MDSMDRKDSKGEGNHEAGREYQRRTKKFVEEQDVESAAEDAKEALEGEEGEELERARKQTKAPDSRDEV